MVIKVKDDIKHPTLRKYETLFTLNIIMFVILVLAIGAVVYAGAKSGLLTGLVVSHTWSEVTGFPSTTCPSDQFVQSIFSNGTATCAAPAGGGGGVGGSGTANYLPVFTNSNTLGNSILSQSPTTNSLVIGQDTSSNSKIVLKGTGAAGYQSGTIVFQDPNDGGGAGWEITGGSWGAPLYMARTMTLSYWENNRWHDALYLTPGKVGQDGKGTAVSWYPIGIMKGADSNFKMYYRIPLTKNLVSAMFGGIGGSVACNSICPPGTCKQGYMRNNTPYTVDCNSVRDVDFLSCDCYLVAP